MCALPISHNEKKCMYQGLVLSVKIKKITHPPPPLAPRINSRKSIPTKLKHGVLPDVPNDNFVVLRSGGEDPWVRLRPGTGQHLTLVTPQCMTKEKLI